MNPVLQSVCSESVSSVTSKQLVEHVSHTREEWYLTCCQEDAHEKAGQHFDIV